MALVLGELATILTVDQKEFDQRLGKAKKDFEGFGGKLKMAAAAAGAAAGAALAAGVIGAMNVEKANDKLAAQIGATGPEAERLGRIAGDLYAGAWGDSVEHVNQALGSVRQSIEGMANTSEDRLKTVTATALDFASTFEIDVARAAQVAGNAVSSGLADNAEQAFDLLTKASQEVPPQLREDVLDAVDEYGQFFNTVGMKGPEAFGILAAGAEKGMFGIDKAGDAVKEFTIRATDLSTATQEAFKSIGVDTDEMTNKILAGGGSANDAFGQIIDGLLGIKDPGKQAEAAIALFGTPLEDLNASQIPEFLESLRSGEDALGDVEGAAAKMGDQLNDNAATTLEGFKRSAKQALEEQLANAIPHLQAVGEFLGEHHDLVVPLVGALGTFAAIVGIVLGLYKVWIAVQTAFHIVMMLSPIGLIILAIVALIAIIVLIATKTTWFQDLWSAAWGGIKAAALAVGRWFRDTLWQKWIVGAFNGIRDTAMGMVDWFRKLPGRVKDALVNVASVVSAPFRAGFNMIAGFWNRTAGQLSFTVPDWVPGFGGRGFSLPQIPQLASGGRIMRSGVVEVGEQGRELLHLPRGAQVEPLDSHQAGAGRRDLPDEFVAEAKIDLGEGIERAVKLKFERRNRDVVRRTGAGTGRAA